MDWTVLEKVGIAGVALGGFWIIYKIFELCITQWSASTDALNRNSQSNEQLAIVFGQAHEREIEFHKELMNVSKDTNNKVSELHRELIEKANRQRGDANGGH